MAETFGKGMFPSLHSLDDGIIRMDTKQDSYTPLQVSSRVSPACFLAQGPIGNSNPPGVLSQSTARQHIGRQSCFSRIQIAGPDWINHT